MAFLKLPLRPGIVRETTDYTNQGGWYSCDKIRFIGGLPQKIGGWEKLSNEQFLGICRSILRFVTLDGDKRTGFGTNLKYYIEQGGDYFDITPIRRDVTLGTDPFDATDTETTVVVNDTGHGATEGDFVTFSGVTTFAGIPADDLNTEHQITEIIDANSYTISVATAATSTASGGGSSVDAAYQINIGAADASLGIGYGAGAYGLSGYGTYATGGGVTLQLRTWANDTYGEDLIINPRDGNIYYVDSTTVSSRAVALEDLGGASNVPTVAREILVSDVDRHVIAFGTNPIGSSTQDTLLVRWADQEDYLNWTPTTTTSAGDFRIGSGSEFITATQTRQEILIWTDNSLHSMQYIGGKIVFGQRLIAQNISIIGPNAKVAAGDSVYWMGRSQFYVYNGQVQILKSTVLDFVFTQMNFEQGYKVYASVNAANGEVRWDYTCVDGEENDRYVVFNYVDNVWYYGTMERTAWADRSLDDNPIAASSDGYLYYHEVGFDDGSTNPPSAIEAYVESSPIELGEGDDLMFIGRAIPDITFRNSTASSPSGTLTLTTRNYPGAGVAQTDGGGVTRTATSPVQEFTQQVYVRLRGRSVIVKFSSDGTGVGWRLGTLRLDVRKDGKSP